ncbi:MAG: permease, partial [Gammaproteobacteria bacterium]
MMDAKTILLVLLAVFTVGYLFIWIRGIRAASGGKDGAGAPTLLQTAIGAVTNFFDTLGIGSFATTTSAYRFLKLVRDEYIPGTMNIGHTLPTIAQAFIYTAVIPVDKTTLIALIAAAVAGSWLGAGVVAGWPRRKIQLGMGSLLIAGALLYSLQSIDEMRVAAGGTKVFPGGDALGLEGGLLAVGVVGNFVLGALMSLGIGLYAPCMIMIALLGMNPSSAFPIMMSSCAFLMPFSSARFIAKGAWDAKA